MGHFGSIKDNPDYIDEKLGFLLRILILCRFKYMFLISIAQLRPSSSLAEPDMCPIVIGERSWKRHTEVSLGPYQS